MSTTTYLELFKHDDPANNTSEFDVDKSLNENWDKIDENAREVSDNIDEIIDKVKEHIEEISNIKAKNTDQDKYISELEAENTRLREDLNGLPKRQASGETIDLSDSAEMRCELKISGNSKQETRTTGKNKFNLGEDTYTRIGIDVTIDKNRITLNGTSNSSNNIFVTGKLNASYLYLGKFKAGTYRFSKFITSGTYEKNSEIGTGTFACNIRKEDATSLGNIGDNSGNKSGLTITLTEDTDLYFQIWINAGAVFTNYVLDWQLEEGDTTTDLEQFIPNSPSPNYPSEVKCCGDNINILDWNNCISGIFWDLNNGGSKGTASNAWAVNNYQKVKNNHISFSTTLKLSSGTTYGRVLYYDKNKTIIGNTAVNSFPSILTVPSNAKYYTYFFLLQYLPMNCELKLEEGEVATPYSPYGQGCINEVICNKNLAVIEIGSISTVEGLEVALDHYYRSKFIEVFNNKTFTASYNTNYSSKQVVIFEYDKDKNFLRFTNTNSSRHTAVVGDDTKYIRCRFLTETDIAPTNTQIEEGSTATPYEEHKSQTYTIPTQQPFRATEDIRDTFIKKNNKWYERHYIARKIFDGTESFAIKSQTEEYIVFEINQTGKARGFTNIICSHFKTLNSTTEECVRGSTGSSYVYINISKGRLSSIDSDGFKEWLTSKYNAGTPVYVDYLLETPLDIECTEEQSTILDQIEKEAKTYKNITHMYSTDNVSPVIDVTYKKDIDTMITNIEQAILSQGGNI